MERDLAEDALGELVKWSLVGFLPYATGEGGRYKLHDLARVFAESRMDAVARDPVRLRHAKHHQKLLLVANELFMQGNDSLAMGLKLFDVNWINIKSGQMWASENKSRSDEMEEICSNFAWAGSILILRLHPLINIKRLEAVLVAARKTKNQNTEDAHLGNLGNTYFRLGETRTAIEYYEQALKISHEISWRASQGHRVL